MRKGLFWVIPDDNDGLMMLAHSAGCDNNGTITTGQPEYNSKKGNSYSHERTWPLVTESLPARIRSKPWNHFPRGRVEIANGKANVYHNPSLPEWAEFQSAVLRYFELESIHVRFIPDYSKHYETNEDWS